MFRIAATFIASAVVASAALGFEIGQAVVVIRDADLKVQRQIVGKAPSGSTLQVAAIQGKWLWVNSGHPGWIDSRYVAAKKRPILESSETAQNDSWDVPQPEFQSNGEAPQHGTKALDSAAADSIADSLWLLSPNVWNDVRDPVWIVNGENDETIRDISASLRFSPTNPFAFDDRRSSVLPEKDKQDGAAHEINELALNQDGGAFAFGRANANWNSIERDRVAAADENNFRPLDPPEAFLYIDHNRVMLLNGEAFRGPQHELTRIIVRLYLEHLIHELRQSVQPKPKYGKNYVMLGYLEWKRLDNCDAAIADFNLAVRLAPDDPDAYAVLAWFLATCPDHRFRNEPKAVENATMACKLTGWSDSSKIAILAAVYAEADNFVEAVKWQQKALDLGRAALKVEYQSRLYLNRRHESFPYDPRR